MAPDIFYSSTDRYSILTKLLDSNAILRVGTRSVNCFRYVQTLQHDFYKEYRIVYIDKTTLLPYKFEYYDDEDLKHMGREIFATVN